MFEEMTVQEKGIAEKIYHSASDALRGELGVEMDVIAFIVDDLRGVEHAGIRLFINPKKQVTLKEAQGVSRSEARWRYEHWKADYEDIDLLNAELNDADSARMSRWANDDSEVATTDRFWEIVCFAALQLRSDSPETLGGVAIVIDNGVTVEERMLSSVAAANPHGEAAEWFRNIAECTAPEEEGSMIEIPPTPAPIPLERNDLARPPFTNSLGMTMIWCPPGRFVVGSPESEEGRQDHETQHLVTLTRGFWMSQCPVTQKQWEAVMKKNPSHFKRSGPAAPVEQVSWSQALKFCADLTAKDAPNVPGSGTYTLPTEAQWEYACRAGHEGVFSLDGIEKLAWYSKNSDDRTHPVGQKAANAWGLHDMLGNVLEWCLDWNGLYPDQEVVDPTGAEEGEFRILRGGSYMAFGIYCRPAWRTAGVISKGENMGFRPVMIEQADSPGMID